MQQLHHAAAADGANIISPAVRSVCEQHGAAIDLVMDNIYGFLDFSGQWNATMAALCGHRRLVQRLSAHHSRAVHQCCPEAMDSAAEFGHLEIVQWLHQNRTEGCTTDAMDMAAANGHLAVVQWLHGHRKEGCTKTAMDFAAQHGHLEVVQWLHWHRKEGCTKSAMDNAANEGHLHVVQWLHEHRSEGCSKSAMGNACSQGHRHVAQWLLTHRPQKCDLFTATEKALVYGHTAIAQWLDEVRYSMDGWDDDLDSPSTNDEDEGAFWMEEAGDDDALLLME